MEYFCQRYRRILCQNAGKALFVWFRRRKDNEHLISFVLGKCRQQEPRTKTFNLQAELVNICHYGRGEENIYGWVGSTVITHLQYLNLHINSVLLGLNIEEEVK